MQEAIGIKQIAKLANVSIGTVDRVLHDRAGVSKLTRKKVQKIIEETGYVKNNVASRLKLAATKKIKFAILLPTIKDSSSYWKLPKKGIVKAVEGLKEMGVTAHFYEFINTDTFLVQSNHILLKPYDALVTVPFFEKEGNQLLKKAASKQIPVVFLDTEIPLHGSPYFIGQNSYKAGMVAGRLLHGMVADEGAYYVVNIVKEEGVRANNLEREQGFRAFFEKNVNKAAVRTINYKLEGDFKVTKEMKTWFTTDVPKGIFITNSKSHLLCKVLEHFKVENAFLVGFDLNRQNLKCLKREKINFLINQQPEYQGYSAIMGLFNYVTKRELSGLDIDIPIEILVKENIED